MTPLPDLLTSFLSCAPQWSASDAALARKILVRLKPPAVLGLIQRDPALIMEMSGMPPDPWQTRLLRSRASRSLLLCNRQAGKSTTTAALALRVALLEPPALVLLLSPTLRQSGELFRDKVVRLYGALGRPVPPVQETALTMGLANGSRIVSLPGDEKNIRGYSGVSLLIVDEASRVEDSLYYAVRPMLAVSGGSMVCLSTPYGKRGWFHEAWSGNERWDRYRITAKDCPRITSEFLAEERRALGPRWFAQEYECSFEDAVDQVFAYADIMAALSPDLEPLSLE
jgi:Terminase large subunit, T4likevirus-type, N-terminal